MGFINCCSCRNFSWFKSNQIKTEVDAENKKNGQVTVINNIVLDKDSNLNTVLKILTVLLAIIGLVIAIQNRRDAKEKEKREVDERKIQDKKNETQVEKVQSGQEQKEKREVEIVRVNLLKSINMT